MIIATLRRKRRLLRAAPAGGEVEAELSGGRDAAFAAMERDIDLFADQDFEETGATTPPVTTASGASQVDQPQSELNTSTAGEPVSRGSSSTQVTNSTMVVKGAGLGQLAGIDVDSRVKGAGGVYGQER